MEFGYGECCFWFCFFYGFEFFVDDFVIWMFVVVVGVGCCWFDSDFGV